MNGDSGLREEVGARGGRSDTPLGRSPHREPEASAAVTEG